MGSCKSRYQSEPLERQVCAQALKTSLQQLGFLRVRVICETLRTLMKAPALIRERRFVAGAARKWCCKALS